jgi:hypothetical protein
MAQNVTVEIKGSKALLTRVGGWSKRSAPSFDLDVPAGSTLTVKVDGGTIGSINVDGEMELDNELSTGSVRVLRWSSAAMKDESGSATIKLTDASGKLDEVEISVDMEDEASAEVEGGAPSKQLPFTGNDLIDAYGAYAIGLLGALGALIFAVLMPAHQAELLSGAGAIALWSFFATNKYDSYALRFLAFVAAGVCLVFAMTVLPAQVHNLIYAAGGFSFVAIYWGDRGL